MKLKMLERKRRLWEEEYENEMVADTLMATSLPTI
jgi:hypothetical protein